MVVFQHQPQVELHPPSILRPVRSWQRPSEESHQSTQMERVNELKSRQFVYKELLATEKVYIEDLKTVLHVI